MEESVAASGNAHDENRLFQALGFHRSGFRSPHASEPQSRLQKVPEVSSHQEPAKRMKARLLVQAVQQNGQRRRQSRRVEVLYSCATHSLRAQIIEVQWP